MMRSLFSAVSGLRVHQTKMDVIANNISNVNTAGYKSSRVTFFDVFNQTISSASRASAQTSRGGTNPMQIGLGANVASIDQLMTTGASQRTDASLDLMIEGEGFFILSDDTGFSFSRNGAFRVDEAGNMTNAGGLLVNGWMRTEDPDNPGEWIINKGKVAPIVITPDMEFTDPETTTNIEMAGNLNAATDGGGEGFLSTMAFYDTVGNRYVVDVVYKFTAATATDAAFWTMELQPDDSGRIFAYNPDIKGKGDEGKFFFNDMGFLPYTQDAYNGTTDVAANSATPSFRFNFDKDGNIIPYTDAGGNEHFYAMFYIDPESANPGMTPPAEFGMVDVDGTDGERTNVMRIDMKDMSQYKMLSNATGTPLDGREAGKLNGTSVTKSGEVWGQYSNGESELLAQIAIAQFQNPSGLEKIGSSLFRATPNSGDFDGVGVVPGTGGSALLSGVLEMANVDLSSEFTEMITTQRGFQANSRVITTSDDMLQELVNLKR